MEALRRLRRTSNDTNVDRRLVTNILLQFLNTPRADSKRFEMLSLLSTILQWDDDEREKAGLQRSGNTPSTVSSIWGRATSPSSAKGKTPELEKTDETEVSYLHPVRLSTGLLTLTLILILRTSLKLQTVLLASLGRIPPHRSIGR